MRGQLFTLDVEARIPEPLQRLHELAGNLWYSWDRATRALFLELNPTLWHRLGHNPRLFLKRVDQTVLEAAAADPELVAKFNRVLADYDTYHGETRRRDGARALAEDDLVAYFCAEYGLHESLPVYSGGLGILAGHHCKTASDLRMPFVAVGLLYRSGYFSQSIDADGNQIARTIRADFDDLPVEPVRTTEGAVLEVGVEFPGRMVFARVWKVRAGHVDIYLLDTDVARNAPEDRAITEQLYGGDRETRIQQELVLGVGGVRALGALGLTPSVWHVNEGHAAFLVLERVRQSVGEGVAFDAALEAVAAATVFTTHTPVPAGHDQFSTDLAGRYLDALRHALGIESERLMALGGATAHGSEFNMTLLALNGSRRHNGVSRIHGTVSSRICERAWPQIPVHENPIEHITNGVHVATVLAEEWVDLFDATFGSGWRSHLADRDYWQRVHELPDHVFWSVRQSIKSNTLRRLREVLLAQHLRNHVSEAHIDRILAFTDPGESNVLTIGFARRFATYKRATLLFSDLDWLRQLVTSDERPVVFVFAGKAHPADQPGQAMLRRVHEISSMPEFVGRVLLVEGYDLALGRQLVAGVDVWLNTPIYPLEASGTSGMKAAINGAPNLSIADGWWGEGFEGDNGWVIRPSPHGEDAARRDAEDARTLYEILQDDVIPLYYARGRHGYSPGWVEACKRAMASILPRFNMQRVVADYATRLYAPAARKGRDLRAGGYAAAAALARWKAAVRTAWGQVAVLGMEQSAPRVAFGEEVQVLVRVRLGALDPGDLWVELHLERRELPDFEDADQDRPGSIAFRRASVEVSERSLHRRLLPFGPGDAPGEHLYRTMLRPEWCGRLSFRVRAYPWHPQLTHRFEMGMMVWL